MRVVRPPPKDALHSGPQRPESYVAQGAINASTDLSEPLPVLPQTAVVAASAGVLSSIDSGAAASLASEASQVAVASEEFGEAVGEFGEAVNGIEDLGEVPAQLTDVAGTVIQDGALDRLLDAQGTAGFWEVPLLLLGTAATGSFLKEGASATGFLLLNLATLIFGTNQVLIEYVQEAGISAGELLFGRFAVATLVLSPWALRGLQNPKLVAASFELGAWLFLAYTAQALGLHYTSASKTSVLLSFTTVLVPFLALLDGKRVGAKTWTAAAIAVVGVGLLTLGGSSVPGASGGGSEELLGDGLELLSAAIFAVQMWRGEKLARKHEESVLELVAVQMGVVCLGAVVYTEIFERPETLGLAMTAEKLGLREWFVITSVQLAGLPWQVPAAVVFMGVVTTAFCLWAETAGLALVDATTAALIYSLEPLWGALFAWVFLAQSLGSPLAWLGAALLLIGSVVGQLPEDTVPEVEGEVELAQSAG